MTKTSADKPKPHAPRKPQRVKIINKKGVIAQPFEKDLGPWLAQGWTRATPVQTG